MRLSNTLFTLARFFLFAFLATFGATWNAILIADLHWLTLGVFALLVVGWLVFRWRNKWIWHATPFDWVLVLWMVVIIISILANLITWRRSLEALWYVSLYIAIFYVLADMFQNGVKRLKFVETLLFLGFAQFIVGIWEVVVFYQTGNTGFPREIGTLANPNVFGAFLVVLLPYAVVAMLSVRQRIAQVVMGLYALVGLLLLLGTFSRGAWIGTAVSLFVVGVLWLAYKNMLSVSAIRGWLSQQSGAIKTLFGIGIGFIGVGLVAGVVFIVASFSIAGRGADLRTLLWEYAVQIFAQQPLTGKGLFTYGYYLPTYWSIPPQQAHAHPHNVPLLILAEFGLLGMAVLVVTLVVVYRMARSNWQVANPREKVWLIGSIASLIGFGVHHLFDTPSLMPFIALCGLFALLMTIVPLQPRPMTARWRLVGHPIGMVVLWTVLLVVGAWQTTIHQAYNNTLEETAKSEDYAMGVAKLNLVLQSDPYYPAYRLQKAYLLALIASTGDAQQAIVASQAYEAYLSIEPYQATAWANLASLYWQSGQEESAQTAIAEAVRLAPEFALFQRQQQIYTRQAVFEDIVPAEADFALSTAYQQYLRYVFPTLFIPQVGWGK